MLLEGNLNRGFSDFMKVLAQLISGPKYPNGYDSLKSGRIKGKEKELYHAFEWINCPLVHDHR